MRLHDRITLQGLLLMLACGGLAPAVVAQEGEAACTAGVYREFDFWVGEWDVFRPDGVVAGTNRTDVQLGGCLLVERWRSVRGGEGTSINYHDPARGAWVQTWIDGTGGIIAVEGAFTDGAMRFEGRHVYPDGRSEPYRMTLAPQTDGSVRQFIEQSRDGGASWYVWFDGRYVRKGSSLGGVGRGRRAPPTAKPPRIV